MRRTRRKWWLWGIGVALAAVLTLAAVIAIGILTHRDQGFANQTPPAQQWPITAGATGDDGRNRSISVAVADAAGSGYDPERGVYVAICAIPARPTIKPGPCLGGVPDTAAQQVEEGTTAYLEVPTASDDHVDCTAVACAIYTRNDHTAAADRVQDLYLLVGFAE